MDKVKIYRYGKYDVMTARMEWSNGKETMAFTRCATRPAVQGGEVMG